VSPAGEADRVGRPAGKGRRLVWTAEAIVGVVVLLGFGLAAAGAPWVAPRDPLKQNIERRLLPPVWYDRGEFSHALGTDPLGRDILSRIVVGGRISLGVGLVGACLGAIVGVGLGVVAGYFGGRVDALVMRVADVQLAFPFILLAIALVAALGPSLVNVVLVLGLTSWVRFARVVRADALALREGESVAAIVALGAGHTRVIARHVLPNIMSPIVVVATLEIPRMILMEAALSFLGLGIQPPAASWGSMVSDGRKYLEIAWWVATCPGLAIMLVVLSVNLLGDWIRDSLDVRL